MSEVVIHSKIVGLGSWRSLKSHSSIMLWYFVRGWDSNNCGKANFSLAEAAITLKKSPNTVRKYLVNGKRIGIFRHYSIRNNLCVVYYTSRNRVAKLLDLDSWGISVKIQLEQLCNSRFHILEGIVKAANQWGLRAASTVSTKDCLQKTIRAIQTSLSRVGALGQRKFVFLNSTHQSYGSSQKKIGEAANVSIRTVNRNLCPLVRLANQLKPIPRVQVCIHNPIYDCVFLGRDTESMSALKLIHPPGSTRTYRLYPCVYQVGDIELVSQCWARRKYKQCLSQESRFLAVAGGERGISKSYGMETAPKKGRGGDTMKAKMDQ